MDSNARPLPLHAAQQARPRSAAGFSLPRAVHAADGPEVAQLLQGAAAAVKVAWKRDGADEGAPILAPLEGLCLNRLARI